VRWLDLFSGIGAYALGLEQAGHEVIGFCEVDEWAKRVLKKHWPTKPISSDILLLNKALMELSGASHAKTFQTQDLHTLTAPDYPAPVQDCSGQWLIPFAWLERDTGLWKTWQLCFSATGQPTWAQYLDAWPPSGVMRNGIAWQRQPLAHPTIVPGHTFLPTLGASDGAGSSRSRYHGSENLMRGRMSDGLRMSQNCPPVTHPNFAEAMLGLPKDYTALETPIPHASSESLPKD